MTHYHFSTLGQCLISLAKQGITSPLKRVLRFIEAGAVVPPPNTSGSLSSLDNKETLCKSLTCPQHQKAKTSSCAPKKSNILPGLVKVDFSKAKQLLDWINLITSPQCATPKITGDQITGRLFIKVPAGESSRWDTLAPLSQDLNQLESPISQSKNNYDTPYEDILLPQAEIKIEDQQHNCDNQQSKESKDTNSIADTPDPLRSEQIQPKSPESDTASQLVEILNDHQEDIPLFQIESKKEIELQQQQVQEKQQLQPEQPQETDRKEEDEMTDLPTESKNGWSHQDIVELAKKLELAAATNETFQYDLSHLVENVFMDKSRKKSIRVNVTNETNLLQLRYATSFKYLPCDLYNLSVGFVTMKGRQLVTTVNDEFLRKHTVGEVFEHSELTHQTTEICDLFQLASMDELMDYFNEQVLKRERFTEEMYTAVNEIATNVLGEVELDNEYTTY